METVRLIALAGGLVTVDITFEVAEPQRIRHIAASNLSDRAMAGGANDRFGQWEDYSLPSGTEVDRPIPGNRRVPIAELTWQAAWPA